MEDRRFDRIVQTWSGRAPRRDALRAMVALAIAGAAGSIGAAGGEARPKRGLKNGRTCNPAHPKQCRSGVCGCNGSLCNCRTRHCAATGESCRSNFGCCAGVCLAGSLLCAV